MFSIWISIRKTTEAVKSTTTTIYLLRIDTGTIITAGLQAITRTNLAWECTIHKLYVIYCSVTGLHCKHQLPTCEKRLKSLHCVSYQRKDSRRMETLTKENISVEVLQAQVCLKSAKRWHRITPHPVLRCMVKVKNKGILVTSMFYSCCY